MEIKKFGSKRRSIPIVPLPPTLIRPKRAKGAEQIVILGVILRITITLAGSEGMSFDVIVRFGGAGLIGKIWLLSCS